ncbi:hypothetical protein [Oceanobacillus sp. Castelsardo]|uniref:hypothetical protein n=1 Tax=Oceanobacillus sp. Castelsardo TaxID=1851204 RepID=UPI000838B0A4|nr:hypothetical protein [Oceanobacillus sp. Castelsardo]
MERYSRIYSFNAYGNKTNLEKTIKNFVDAGWEFIGDTPVLTAPFISVGWLKEKGEIIYPDGYPKPK